MKTKKGIALGLLTVILLYCLPLSAESALGDQETIDRIDAIVRAEAKYDLFSGAVLVAENGRIIYAEALGHANRDHKVPNRLETRFNIGSIGKTFTATLIMQLVQEGKVGLDDPLSEYLPDFPYPEKDRIRIKHLLNHTSGLDDYMRHADYDAKKDELRRIEDVLPLIYDQKPLFQPGEKWSYSNSGMIVLGAVIEKRAGMDYGKYLKKRILDPLGMKDSCIVYPEEVVPDRATGYNNIYLDGAYQVEVLREPPAFSDGGLYTTVLDMLKFDQALYGEELLTEEYKKIMFTPVAPSRHYAYGWIVVPFGNTKVIYHGGGCAGFNAEFRRYPEKGYTIIVLSNYYGTPAFELANKLDCLLLGLPYSLATKYDLHYRRGMYYQEGHKEYKKAVACFEKNLQASEPHLPSLYQSARSRLMGEFDQEKAIEELDWYITLADRNAEPSIAAAWWRKGVAYEQLGKEKSAVECFRSGLELDPNLRQAKEALERIEKKN